MLVTEEEKPKENNKFTSLDLQNASFKTQQQSQAVPMIICFPVCTM